MIHDPHKCREALELVERHIEESITANQEAQVIAALIKRLQERLDEEKK